MADHKQLSADDLKTVRAAVKTPRKTLQNDAERKFVSETKARLERFGEGVYISEKQFSWLAKIASRSIPVKADVAEAGDTPAYDDLAGE